MIPKVVIFIGGINMYLKTVVVFVCYLTVGYCNDILHIEPEGPIVWTRYSKPINISCWIMGIRKTDITWIKNGVSLSETRDFDLTTERLYDGGYITTKVTIFTKDADFKHAGNYTCTNGNVSKYVQIKVIKGKLKIRPSGNRIVAFVNDTVSLLCEYEGNEKLKIEWFKNDIMPVKNLGFISNTQRITGDKIRSTLEVKKRVLESRDSGDYRCLAGPFSKNVELNVYQGSCNNSLITGVYGVADDHITASSYYDDILYTDPPDRARLNTERETRRTGRTNQIKYYGGAWAPQFHDGKEWIMVKLQNLSVIRKLITQGRSSTDCCKQQDWVTSFKFAYSQDNVTWYKYKDNSGNTMIFSGNYDHNTYRINVLPVPVIAQYIQINPVTWNQRIAMRLDVIGCFLPSDIRIIEPIVGSLSLEIPSSLHLSCQFIGSNTEAVTWYKDGRDISNDGQFVRKSISSKTHGQSTIIKSIQKQVTNYTDSGHYMCRHDKLGINKSVAVHIAKLEMQPDPGNHWAIASNPLEISCTYTGAKLEDVNWSYNGEIPVFTKRLETRSDENGVYSVSKIIKEKADISDSGNYSCSVGEFRKTLLLRIIEISRSISSNIITEGNSVTFGCSVFGVPEDVKIDVYWTKGQIHLQDIPSLKDRYEYYPNTKTLIIQNTKFTDAGTYECNVILDVNSTKQYKLDVKTELLATPKTTIEGQKTLKTGDSLHLYCKTDGYPKPQIIWYKGNKELNTKNSRITFLPYDGSDNGHLVVFGVNIDDADEYSCEGVANGFSPMKSSMTVAINESQNGNNLLLIIVIAVCSASLVLVICTVACCFRCRRTRRRMTNAPDALESLSRTRPQVTKMYVDMETSRRPKRSISEEEIRMLPRPPAPTPDIASLSDADSAAYESFRHSSEQTSVKESLDIR